MINSNKICPLVYIIILNWNHKDDLIETIESFRKQEYSNLKLVISDNGSTDQSIETIKKNYSDIAVIENRKNLGWAEGNNVGIKYAIDNDADYILLANNDIAFEQINIISRLLNAFQDIPNLGIIGPKENSYYDRNYTVNEGWIMYPKAKFIFNNKRVEIDIKGLKRNYRKVDNVSGSFMLIKKSIFNDLALMDPKLFLYAEDTDFSLRAWEKGWISIIDTDLIIFHKISASAGNNSSLKIYYKTRNLIYLIRKHKKLQENHVYFLLKYYFDALKLSFKIMLFKEFDGGRFDKLKAHCKGVLHGSLEIKMGKYY